MTPSVPHDAAIGPVIAADGGGSRCRLALDTGHRVHHIEMGACNLTSDFNQGIRILREGLHLLSEESAQPLTDIPAVFALAGVVSDDIARQAETALPLARVRVCEDRLAALRGALGKDDGAVLHAGTGSFLARQQDGRARFAGGWGPQLGDEGSGYWIGREALRHGLRVFEKRAAPGDLARWLGAEIGAGPALIAFARSGSVKSIAALAPCVVDAAASDPAAGDILSRAATHLADNLADLSDDLPQRLCLTGGVAPHLEPYLPSALQARVTAPDGTPLDGALAMARDLAVAQ